MFYSELLHVVKDIAASGILIPKVEGKVTRVYRVEASMSAAVNMRFLSAATEKTSWKYFGKYGAFVWDVLQNGDSPPVPWVECGVNEDFSIELSSAINVGLDIWYTQG